MLLSVLPLTLLHLIPGTKEIEDIQARQHAEISPNKEESSSKEHTSSGRGREKCKDSEEEEIIVEENYEETAKGEGK